MRALLARDNQGLYELAINERAIHCVDAIRFQLRETHVEALTSSCGQFDFWFSPSLRAGNRGVNRLATAMLFTVTGFTATEVPLMRGAVVVTSHDQTGKPAGLTIEQCQRLGAACYDLPRRSACVLAWRFRQQERRHRRQITAHASAAARCRF